MTPITVAPDGATITLVSNNQTYTSGLNMNSRTSRLAGARWSVSLNWGNRKGREAANLAAQLTALDGAYGAFTIRIPEYSRFGAVQTNGTVVSAPLHSETITATGFTANTTAAFCAGDWIECNGAAYKVSEDANTDGSGQVVLKVTPRVRRVPAVGALVEVLAPKMTLRVTDSSGIGFALSAAVGSPVYAIGIEALEID